MKTAKGGMSWDFSRARSLPTSCSRTKSNRTTPKTQSALLEAMQEKQVTAGVTHLLAGTPFS